MVGWPLGTSIAGGEPNWVMAGIGAGLVVISIPVNNKFIKQATQAVKTYNEGKRVMSSYNKTKWQFGISGYGIGLTVEF